VVTSTQSLLVVIEAARAGRGQTRYQHHVTCGVVRLYELQQTNEETPRPYPEDLIVLEIRTNKQTNCELRDLVILEHKHAPRPCLENFIVPEIKTNTQLHDNVGTVE